MRRHRLPAGRTSPRAWASPTRWAPSARPCCGPATPSSRTSWVPAPPSCSTRWAASATRTSTPPTRRAAPNVTTGDIIDLPAGRWQLQRQRQPLHRRPPAVQRAQPEPLGPQDRRGAARRRARPAAGVRGRLDLTYRHSLQRPRGAAAGLRRPERRTRRRTWPRSAGRNRAGSDYIHCGTDRRSGLPDRLPARAVDLHPAELLRPPSGHQHPQRLLPLQRRQGAGVQGRFDRLQQASRQPLDAPRQRDLLRLDVEQGPGIRAVRIPPRSWAAATSEGDAVLQGSGTASGAPGRRLHQQQVGVQRQRPVPDRARPSVGLQRRRSTSPAARAIRIPYYHRVRAAGQQQSWHEFMQATDSPDSFRLDNINIVDARAGEGVQLQRLRSDHWRRLLQRLQQGLTSSSASSRIDASHVRTTSARSPARGFSASALVSASVDPVARSGTRIELMFRRGATPGGFFCPPFGIHFPAHAVCIPGRKRLPARAATVSTNPKGER